MGTKTISLDMLYRQIGENITFLRKSKGIIQYALASEIGVSQSMISQYEKAKTKVSLKALKQIADYLDVSLEDLMFKDFQKNEHDEKQEELNFFGSSDPITKCARSTYFLYYIKEIDGTADIQIGQIIMRINKKESAYSASASLQFPKVREPCDTIITMDGSYAYVDYHSYERDFFFHLIFYYHRNATNTYYHGGLGLIQMCDAKGYPITQFCVISRNQISKEKEKELRSYLAITEYSGMPRYKQVLSSNSILRLAKNRDASLFDWLKKNNYTTYNKK